MSKSIEYIVTARGGRALASFETVEAAENFRDQRHAMRVPTRLFKVETTREEIA